MDRSSHDGSTPPAPPAASGDVRSQLAVAAREFRSSLGLLKTRRFGTFWFAGLLSNIGTWAQWVAEPWLLLNLGASPFLIGLDSFAYSSPGWLLTPVGGWLADRRDRRQVIAFFQAIQLLCPLAIIVLLLTGTIGPWIIIGLSLVVGITDALSMPSFQSIVPSIVEREQISPALALNSTQFNLSRVLGPAIAGVLIATIGVVACFAVSAVSYVPFIGVALWILPRRPPGEKTREAGTRPLAGFRAIIRNGHLRGALATVFATSLLCGPLVTFCPVLVKNALHGDASRFSLAVGSFGLGGLLGAIMLLAVPARQDRRRWASHAAIAYAMVVVAASLSPWFWTLPLLMVLAGGAMALSNISANSLLQSAARPELLGQTVSLFMLAMQGGLSLGSLLTGASVIAFGVREALFLNGALAILMQWWIGRRWLAEPTTIAGVESPSRDAD